VAHLGDVHDQRERFLQERLDLGLPRELEETAVEVPLEAVGVPFDANPRRGFR